MKDGGKSDKKKKRKWTPSASVREVFQHVGIDLKDSITQGEMDSILGSAAVKALSTMGLRQYQKCKHSFSSLKTSVHHPCLSV